MGQDSDKGFGLKPATAIGYSIVSNLGGDRQMTVQCFVDEDEADDVVNRRIDRVMAVLDRQKAKYDLDKEIKEFEEVALHTRNFLNAIPMAEQAAKAQIERLNAQLVGQQDARKEVHDQAYDAFKASGRRGQFKPSGAVEGRLRNMDAEIAKTVEAIKAVPNDTLQNRNTTFVNIRKYQDDLTKRREKINALRALAGQPPYELFVAEETTVPEMLVEAG